MHASNVVSPDIMPRIVEAVVIGLKAKVDKFKVLQELIGSMLCKPGKR